MAGRADFEERKQAKIDRYNEAAIKANTESQSRYNTACNIGKNIPFGQPILVGHHSEAHARRDADKIFNNMNKSIEASEKAAYYAGKAVSVENNNVISSDDPNSIEKLTEKVEKLKEAQAYMKKANAHYRKNKTMKGYGDLSDEDAQKADANIKNGYSWEQQPYKSYELTSINSKIKAAKERIEKIQRVDAMPHEVIEIIGGQIVSNAEINRVQIIFDERQGEEITNILQRNGFHWSPTEKAWQRLRSPQALKLARRLFD